MAKEENVSEDGWGAEEAGGEGGESEKEAGGWNETGTYTRIA